MTWRGGGPLRTAFSNPTSSGRRDLGHMKNSGRPRPAGAGVTSRWAGSDIFEQHSPWVLCGVCLTGCTPRWFFEWCPARSSPPWLWWLQEVTSHLLRLTGVFHRRRGRRTAPQRSLISRRRSQETCRHAAPLVIEEPFSRGIVPSPSRSLAWSIRATSTSAGGFRQLPMPRCADRVPTTRAPLSGLMICLFHRREARQRLAPTASEEPSWERHQDAFE